MDKARFSLPLDWVRRFEVRCFLGKKNKTKMTQLFIFFSRRFDVLLRALRGHGRLMGEFPLTWWMPSRRQSRLSSSPGGAVLKLELSVALHREESRRGSRSLTDFHGKADSPYSGSDSSSIDSPSSLPPPPPPHSLLFFFSLCWIGGVGGRGCGVGGCRLHCSHG